MDHNEAIKKGKAQIKQAINDTYFEIRLMDAALKEIIKFKPSLEAFVNNTWQNGNYKVTESDKEIFRNNIEKGMKDILNRLQKLKIVEKMDSRQIYAALQELVQEDDRVRSAIYNDLRMQQKISTETLSIDTLFRRALAALKVGLKNPEKFSHAPGAPLLSLLTKIEGMLVMERSQLLNGMLPSLERALQKEDALQRVGV